MRSSTTLLVTGDNSGQRRAIRSALLEHVEDDAGDCAKCIREHGRRDPYPCIFVRQAIALQRELEAAGLVST